MHSDTIINLPNDLIPGYRLEGELGRGGMATVYLAVQESLNRQVALKVMHPVLASDDAFAKRFLNEGQIVGQLNHANIVTIFDVGAYDGHYFLAMELLPGGSLRDRIQRGLPLARALASVKDLAAALGYAHRRGFVHRDIKPQNVLFRDDDAPVLTDFGIAKALGATTQLTKTGFTYGSVGYMSPEQAMGQPIDHRADLYSFGVMVWEMLTGHQPYQAEDAFTLAQQHVSAPIPDLPQTLQAFQPIINKLLAKQPDDRYHVIEQFLVDVDQVSKQPPKPTTDPVPQTPNPTVVIQTPRAEPPDSTTPSKTVLRVQLGILGTLLVLANGGALFFVPSLNPFTATATKINDTVATLEASAQAATESAQPAKASNRVTPAPVPVASDPPPVPADGMQPEIAALPVQRAAEDQAENIQPLLRQAQIFWEAGQYHEPEGANALDTYRQVLTLDPANRQAQARLRELGRMGHAARAYQAAQERFKAGEVDASLAEIRRGLRSVPDSPVLVELRKQVQTHIEATERATPRTDDIDELLQRAEQHMAAGRYAEPVGDNAFETYRHVLALAPNQGAAITGLLNVGRMRNAQRALQTAENLLQAGDLEASLATVKQGLRHVPDFPALLQLQQRLQARLE